MMRFDQTTSSKKRKMIYLPEENPTDFLFFFEKGNSGISFSVRDYSVRHRVTEKYQSDFHCSAAELLRRARMVYDAPTVDTNNLEFWHNYTLLGRELITAPPTQVAKAVLPASDSALPAPQNPFPILDRSQLEALPKFRKSGDVDRMLLSPNSEDWVTWNMMRLLARAGASGWSSLQEVARSANAGVDFDFLDSTPPRIACWRLVKAPSAYEKASRERMRRSSDPALAQRAGDRAPVEGNSEIDIEFHGRQFLIFVEAKLGSDISLSTTYDPHRNQIVRNIDCVIEEAQGLDPAFWMMVRDRAESRAYVQLVRRYREEPASLAAALPHRDPEELAQVARRMAFLCWKDLGEKLCGSRPDDDAITAKVKSELRRRIA